MYIMKKFIITILIIIIVFSFIGCKKTNNNTDSTSDLIKLPTSDKIEASGEVQFWAQDGVNMLIHMLTVDGFYKDNNQSSKLITIDIQENKITNLQLVKQLDFHDKETIDLYVLDFKLLPKNLIDNSLFALDDKGWITSDDNFIYSDAVGYEAKKGQLYLLINNNDGVITGIGIRRAEPLTEKWCKELVDYYNVSSNDIGAMNEISDRNSFNLTAEEQKVYDLFKINKDDALLKNLEPISIAKLYIQASLDEDYETQYGFYFIENLNKGQMGWTLEEHLKIPKKDRGSKEFIYENLVPLVNGEFIMMDENKGYIKYQIVDEATSEILDMGFRMERGKNKIWKVSFMPIQ